ncbi:hypothetical protein DPMN_072183 [Dreissena polymorpha]|uniref:Uncharacterized protein n=1 Tax=Dreissena polymorpha TaxID=45954 RepID=A0A9D3Z5U9_DREPO|nr:hypothetical protein DPMN_072183 [Dreissena polymorpha]
MVPCLPLGVSRFPGDTRRGGRLGTGRLGTGRLGRLGGYQLPMSPQPEKTSKIAKYTNQIQFAY